MQKRIQEWHARRAALQRGASMEPMAAERSSELGTGTVLGSPDHATAPGPEDDEPWPPEPWCSTYTQAVSRKAGVPRLTGQARDLAANASTNRQLKQALRRLPLEDSPAELICVAIFAVFVWPALPAWLVHTFRPVSTLFCRTLLCCTGSISWGLGRGRHGLSSFATSSGLVGLASYKLKVQRQGQCHQKLLLWHQTPRQCQQEQHQKHQLCQRHRLRQLRKCQQRWLLRIHVDLWTRSSKTSTGSYKHLLTSRQK